MPAIIENLGDPDSRVQSDAADLLASFGKEAKAAVPALFTAMRNREGYTRYCAAYALSQIEPETAKDAVPILIQQLNDTNRCIRIHAVRALGEFAQRSKLAVPDLLKALNDRDKELRFYVGDALKKIAPDVAAKAGVE